MPPGCNPTSFRSQVSWPWSPRWPEALPGQSPPRRDHDRESKSRRWGPGEAGEPRAATHPGAQELPGSHWSAVEGRSRAPGPETSRVARSDRRRERVRGADPARPTPASAQPGSPAPASEQPLGSSPASGRSAACRRPMGTPRAGWRHGPPTSELPCRASLRVVSGAHCSSQLSAPRSLARSTAHTQAHTHSPHTHAAWTSSAAARNVGAPPVTGLDAAPFGWVLVKCDSLVLQK